MTSTLSKVLIVKIDNVYGRIVSESSELMGALYKQFAVPAHNFWFHPKYKAGVWDGKIRFVGRDGVFSNGMLKDIKEYLGKQSEYELEVDPRYDSDFPDKAALKEEFVKIVSQLDCPLVPRYYQLRGAVKSIYLKRCINEHCTGSGKTLTMALVCHFLMNKFPDFKFLILVPRLDLVEQFTEDFISYGIPAEMLGKFTGKVKDTKQKIIVSTWQSMAPETAFIQQFDVLLCDEVHIMSGGKVVRSVGENAINAQYRIGFTGTLPEEFKKAERMLATSVMGPVSDIVTTEQLIQEKSISDIIIHIPYLTYPKEITAEIKKNQKNLEGIDAERYEKKFIFDYEARNDLIVNITKKRIAKNENTLILVNKIAHLDTIVEHLRKSGIEPYIVSGDVKDIEERNKVRHDIEKEGGKVIVATEGVYSTGISIKRLHAIIFAAAGKSKIRTLQSVGRGLRMHESKTILKLFDIADNLPYSIKHLQPRMEYYAKNNFQVKVREITLA
jgi:superfamily II DNA or RNA helicase